MRFGEYRRYTVVIEKRKKNKEQNEKSERFLRYWEALRKEESWRNASTVFRSYVL